MTTPNKTTKAAAKKEPAKRVRRTKAQIEADRLAEEKRRTELAEERAAKIPAPASPKFHRVYHVLKDGFTVFGNVLYYGQEFEVEEGTENFSRAFDTRGNYIFDKTAEEQYEQWGEIRYAEGPWPGLPYDPNFEFEGDVVSENKQPLKPTEAEREIIRKINARRNKERARN